MRRRTAEHMVRSKQTRAHVLTAVEVDFDAVERARSARRRSGRRARASRLTYLPFIARAFSDALASSPPSTPASGGTRSPSTTT